MIMITGGAGFIGSVLIRELNSIGIKNICVVDRLRDGDKWLNLRRSKYEEFIHADDLFTQNEHILHRVTSIFHIGACSTTTEKDADYFMENNLEYSKELFKIAAKKNIPFIYASSAATYGDGALGYSDSDDIIPKLLPLNPYGYSKQLFDEWVLKESTKPDLWFGLKFFNVYGPNEYHKGEQASVIFRAFNQIKKEGIVKLFKSYKDGHEDGEQKRDFVYVLDIVKAMIELYKIKDKTKSAILNVGTGEAASFNQLALSLFKAMDLPPKIEYIEMPKELKKQYQYFTEAKMDKFYDSIDTICFQNIDSGISDYVRNYLLKKSPYY